MKDEEQIKLLRERIEQMCHRAMKTPRDFDWLSEQLNTSCQVSMSPTTLKRLWGYLPNESVTPRTFTLDTLARFLGYKDFSHYCTCHGDGERSPSDPVLGQALRPAEELEVDRRVRLTWQPGRVCVVRHLGDASFVVERSQCTRLQPGNTFRCPLIIEGEVMHIDHLVQEDAIPRKYKCGTNGGVHFTLIEN